MDNLDYKILQLLSDNNYHSGEKLAKIFHTSRAAICKRVSKLKNRLNTASNSRLDILAVVGKGYCLNSTFDYLCVDEIKAELGLENLSISFVPIIDSTNNYLINSNTAIDQHHVCLSEQQTAGRGRNTIAKQKNWYSPFGSNIYCSIAWHYPGNQSSLLGLSLIAGVSVAETIEQLMGLKVNLKWPNDILIDNCKVAGILTEIFGEPNGGCKLVLGFGINVHNNFDGHQRIDQPWTTLASHAGQVPNRNVIISHLIRNFINNYQMFINYGLDFFANKWHNYDGLKNCMVNITVANNTKLGKYVGIDQSGAIIVEIDGKQQIFHSGEVSIRAVNDYIN